MIVTEPTFNELRHVVGMAQTFIETADENTLIDEPPTEWEQDVVQKATAWLEALEHLDPTSEVKMAIQVLQKHGFDATTQVFHSQTEKMLAISTSHVTSETAKRLSEDTIYGVTVFEKGKYGWWVHTTTMDDPLHPNEVPTELAEAIKLAVSFGCDWIMFDRDAPVIEELPHWEW